MLWLIIVAVLAYFIYAKVFKPMSYWKNLNIPYSKPWPILGNMYPFLLRKKTFVEILQDLYNEFPNERYSGVFSFRNPQLLVRDPELIKQLTIKDFDYFMNRTTQVSEEVEPILAKNLVALSGQTWRGMRATLSPSFTSSKMRFMFNLISECAEKFTTYFENQDQHSIKSMDMKDAFSRFTNDAIATTAFGVTVDSLNDRENEFFKLGQDSTNFGGLKAIRFFGYSIFPALMRLFKITIFPKAFTSFFCRIIAETIEVREKNSVVRPDMIHLLLETRRGSSLSSEQDEDVPIVDKNVADKSTQKLSLSDEDITAQAMVFFFAGFETTSVLMCFMSHELAINPEIQRKLQREIDETLEKFGKITYEALLGMKYLDMVVSESLRKWPPGLALERICVKDYTIQPQLPHERAYFCEKGQSVMIPVVGLHHDPKYFPNPERFDPERFNDENKSKIIPSTYIPFGTGPRNCIALRFALMETKILFFHLLSKFDLVPTEKTVIPLVLSKKKFNLAPDEGFWLGIQPRKVE